MERREFIKSAAALSLVPLIGGKSEAKEEYVKTPTEPNLMTLEGVDLKHNFLTNSFKLKLNKNEKILEIIMEKAHAEETYKALNKCVFNPQKIKLAQVDYDNDKNCLNKFLQMNGILYQYDFKHDWISSKTAFAKLYFKPNIEELMLVPLDNVGGVYISGFEYDSQDKTAMVEMPLKTFCNTGREIIEVEIGAASYQPYGIDFIIRENKLLTDYSLMLRNMIPIAIMKNDEKCMITYIHKENYKVA